MEQIKTFASIVMIVAVSLLLASCSPATKVSSANWTDQFKRKVAITIDDLPTVGARSRESKEKLTHSLISKLVEAKVPAIGFVNEERLGKKQPKPHNIALLQAWVDAGFELGNHTYSHAKFFTTSLDDYKNEVLRGEKVTKTLYSPKDGDVRYFRHPYLSTGPDMQTRLAFEAFLAEHNYEVAPVTLDNSEWVYSKAYNLVGKLGDKELQKKIGEDYVRYMLTTFDFYEEMSQDLFGREIAHTLLLHANQINADYVGLLINAIESRGYEFVSLKDALKDPAYEHKYDYHKYDYIASSGLSWLQRWWITQGNTKREEPAVSEWVNEIAFDKK